MHSIADDERNEPIADNRVDSRCFVSGSGSASASKVQSVDQPPIDRIQKAAKILDCLPRKNSVLVLLDNRIDQGPLPVVFDSMANAAQFLRIILPDTLPVSDVAQVSAEAKHTIHIQSANCLHQRQVVLRK
jgi:hypothetical protein